MIIVRVELDNQLNHYLTGLMKKTGIQIASKVRFYQGLIVHVFGRLAAALFIMWHKINLHLIEIPLPDGRGSDY